MKKLFSSLLYTILSIVLFTLGILCIYGVAWYLLPSIQNTDLSILLVDNIFNKINVKLDVIFIISFSSLFTLMVLNELQGKKLNSKFKNLFIHFNSWLFLIISIVVIIYGLVFENNLKNLEINFDLTRKLGIGVSVILFILQHMLSNKIGKLINRKIQAYDTAKELNDKGRSSIIFVNILKYLELLFPEIILLALICFCTNIQLAKYFILLIVALFLPIIGNIMCDSNIRKEAKFNEINSKKEIAELVKESLNEKE